MPVVRKAREDEHSRIGTLMVEVYAGLSGFPTPEEQPAYYHLLANVGDLTKKPETEILVAVEGDNILGAVVFFGQMQYYGSGGTATLEKNASGFRLLAVSPSAQGKGVGKALTMECIARARSRGHHCLIIHTTKAMQRAWGIYESLGFKRSPDLDFMQGELAVYGFRFAL